MKNGVPYEKAFSLSEANVAAFGIIFNEFEGAEFDWRNMTWKKKQ